MRNTVINYLYEEAKKDKNIMLLIWDLWYWVVEEFQKNIPDQFINVGIAEQNMIGIAAGLALTWKKVFCYSIVPFVTMRCYEQIRVDVCSQNLDVTLIGVWWWFAYGSLGNTHYGIEDINVMKWLPNMKILAPADKHEAKLCVEYLFAYKWPCYIRLNRWWEPDVYENWLSDISIENGIELKTGNDISIISTGNILWNVIKTAEILEKQWIHTQVISIPCIKPMNADAIVSHIKSKKWIFTVEEHTIIWWLGDSIASIMAENRIASIFKKFGIPDIFPSLVWNQEYMRGLVWLDPESLAKSILITLS